MKERDWTRPLALELIEDPQPELPLFQRHFGGVKTMEEHRRLDKLLDLVFRLMKDGEWRTLKDISKATGGSEASCSARLRDFRKLGFGNHTVNRDKLGPGLYIYQLILNPKVAERENMRFYKAKHPKNFDIAI